MNYKKKLAESNILRSFIFPLLSKFDFELRVKHDITKRHITLMSWLHKGYWYYGWLREKEEVERFKELIPKGGCVLEVGGHIGYLTQVFEYLIGDEGIIVVVEPTPRSRYFLHKNVLPSTKVLPVAVSNEVGKMDFFIEEFGGYTNSLVREFTETTNSSLSSSQRKIPQNVKKIEVDVTTIDAICNDVGYSPDFIKIDVEGAELNVLQGAKKTLPDVGSLMVEITRNHKEVYDLLYEFKFKAISKSGEALSKEEYPSGNVFFVR